MLVGLESCTCLHALAGVLTCFFTPTRQGCLMAVRVIKITAYIIGTRTCVLTHGNAVAHA